MPRGPLKQFLLLPHRSTLSGPSEFVLLPTRGRGFLKVKSSKLNLGRFRRKTFVWGGDEDYTHQESWMWQDSKSRCSERCTSRHLYPGLSTLPTKVRVRVLRLSIKGSKGNPRSFKFFLQVPPDAYSRTPLSFVTVSKNPVRETSGVPTGSKGYGTRYLTLRCGLWDQNPNKTA